VQDTTTLPQPASVERPEKEISLFPAIILCDEETAELKVAGLPILDRLIVAAHRAGAAQISVVSSKPLPLLPRTTALGISFKWVADIPNIEQPTVVLSTGVLVQAADLKALVQNRGRLVGRDGVPLPAGVIDEPLVRDLNEQLRQLPEIVAQGVAEPITGASSVSAVSRALWSSLDSPLDGVVDKYFNRPVGRLLSKRLVHTPVSPNQVSVAASLVGLLSALLFADGSHEAAVLGAIVLQLSAILDTVDGDLARAMFKESELGKWLDIVGDQVVHVAVFVAIGVGLYRAGSAAPVVALAASAGVGVVISFIVVVRGLKQLESRSNPRSQKLIEATANRDFSVLLIIMALLDKLDWFLWIIAVGVHVFWIAALVVQKTGLPRTGKTEYAP
jgi:phosphatidylglycerophosphate synthase